MEPDRSKLKIALITGASRRIGAQIARTLHASGWTVLLHCRSSVEDAEQLQAELQQSPQAPAVQVYQADLLDLDAIPGLARRITDDWGQLDLLVNNASTFYPTPIESATPQDWNDLFGSNLKAPFFLIQALLPLLQAANGCVVNLVDIHAERPMPNHPIYSAAKSGLLGLTRALAVDLAPRVRVNGVSPGAILWPEAGPEDEAAKSELLARVPMGRLGCPEDIAKAVRYLAEDAPYVTGQVIAVDGGRSVRI